MMVCSQMRWNVRSNTFTEAAAEAARQKQAQAAARAAEFEAAALAWLTEPSAPPSQSRLKGRKAHAGRASQSKELKQAPQQQDADDSTEASLDDNDEEVITDITPSTVEAHDQLTNSSFASGRAGARRLAPSTPPPPSTPHHIAQSAPCHILAQRQSDSIRLENLSKRALADWKVQMRGHRARVHIDHQPSNLLNDKDLRIFTPRDEELLLRPGEVWKLDLHKPQWLRERGCSLEATLAGDAVEVYLKILQTHLCTSLLTHDPPCYIRHACCVNTVQLVPSCIACCNAVSHYYRFLSAI
ncbi:TPA: hypothetical protein ACH3X3_011899 [Trebouxia sp. C0006]